MHSAGTNVKTNSGTKSRLNISNVGPGFSSTKLAGAPHIRVSCECLGVCSIHAALTLAVFSALMLIAAHPAQAQTETVLYNFANSPDGSEPVGGLTSHDGNFYGTTQVGGAHGQGTVFELSPSGVGGWNETVLYNFCSVIGQNGNCDDGSGPQASVIFDNLGNLYGTTAFGGTGSVGAVFELSPAGTSWTETVLPNVTTRYSYFLGSGLIMDPAGNLYGTTRGIYGAVYELSPSGGGWTEQQIYQTPFSDDPFYTGLTMDAAGNIFGATLYTLLELSPNGEGGWNPTSIHQFGHAKDGSYPLGTPVLDQAGNIYGTTQYGGAKGNGTVYKMTPGKRGKWTEKILYSFKGGAKDGSQPRAGIVFDAAGNIYGTTSLGNNYSGGVVFELVAPVGTGSYKEKVLWSFNGTDGADPVDSLIWDNEGNLYGTAVEGGSSGNGVVFEVTP